MGRFLSGNVSDSFRRVQYLFRLYSLPHRAVGRKSRPRMRGQFLPLADPRWHSHTQTLQHHQSLFFLPVLLARPGVRANFTMPPLFVCWSCVCNAFCRGLCVWISVEVFVVITLEAMASARDAPCCSPQLSTRHRAPGTRIQKDSQFQRILHVLSTFGESCSFNLSPILSPLLVNFRGWFWYSLLGPNNPAF